MLHPVHPEYWGLYPVRPEYYVLHPVRPECCVVGSLRPESRLAFQRQVRQTHRTHRMQGNIFADAGTTKSSRFKIWLTDWNND